MKTDKLTLICLLAITIACSDKDSTPASNTELLSASVWRYDNAGIDTDKNGTTDSPLPPGYVSSCETDNTLKFEADGKGIIDEGASTCTVGDPQSVPFSWTFASGETTINFPSAVFAGISGDVKILKLTSTELHLSKEVSVGLPFDVTVIVQLKH
ncbi:MAG: hypothetical protein H7Y31_05640 [Chitinophagaceae bacterium]|nr:hypothetical protein [Chitinophagaceae bacterium]